MTIITKIFSGHYTMDEEGKMVFTDSDVEINEFLANNDGELIDIKYSTTYAEGNIYNSALVIYKLSEESVDN